MKYRPEVDGIRAVAVVPVILFHAGVPGFAGGYVGVDIFFVISGYLITRLINAEIERGEFSLVRFYERRARRILPALFVVCLACIPFARAWYLPDDYESFGRSLLAVAGFVSNFYFWLQGDYFAAPSETLPLFHTWSLAVEEQFYIMFPLLLMAMNSRGRAQKVACVLGISVVSLGIATFATDHPSANFYLMPSRAWELGTGALVALLDDHRVAAKWTQGRRDLLATLGVALVAASFWLFTPETHHPGLMTLLPVLGTVALIMAATPQTLVGRVLSHRALVGIGLLSYSAYLWHQPLLAFARTHLGKLEPLQIVAMSAATFALAWLSWRFVEQPFRRRTVSRVQVFRLATVGSLAIATIGVLAIVTDGSTGRTPTVVVAQSWVRDRSPSYNACISRIGRPIDLSRTCVYGRNDGGLKLAIVGDSQAATIAHRLAEATADSGWPLIEITRAACPPALGLEIQSRLGVGCGEFNAAAARRLAEQDIKVVVMLARWSQYLHDQPFDNGEGGSIAYVSRALPVGFVEGGNTEAERQEAVGRHYARAVSTLLDQGKRVVLVYPVPEVGWRVPQEMVMRRRAAIGRPKVVSTDHGVFRARNAATYAALDSIPDSPSLVRVKPEALFCNSVVPGRCIAEIDGRPLYWDDSHLNESVGAPLVARQVRQALDAAGWLQDRPNAISALQPASVE